jgi:Na+-transporting methylmalonyl-CoA/oxaloacetate decarboxylase gamma subunit
MIDIGRGEALLIALGGYLVVFIGLVLLMCVVMITGKIMVSSRAKKAAPAAEAPAIAPPAAAPALAAAPGSAGELKLYDVDPKDAAMIMAIVAHQLGKPLNELRFKSIREVK